jgi:hypothetical protein
MAAAQLTAAATQLPAAAPQLTAAAANLTTAAAQLAVPVPHPIPDHEFTLFVVDGHVKAKAPQATVVGQIVRFTCPDGAFRVEFQGESPYEVFTVRDSMLRPILKAGNFKARCFVTPTGQTQEIGWTPGDEEAGLNQPSEPPPPPQ